jgi:lipopolysaccharide transport system permease protein
MNEMLKALWRYRFFIFSSIKTEFYSRFTRSKLGGMWMILHPLAQVLIYALILSTVLSAKLPGIDNRYAYAIYLMAGMAGWTLFFDVVSRSLTVFIDNGNLLKKIAFPKLSLPLIVIGSALVNYVLLLLAMFVVFGLLGHLAYHALLWLPVLMVISLAMAAGIGLFLGILNVFLRDIGQIMGIVLQFWFWLTPVVYVMTMFPETYRDYFLVNPMTGIVMGYHNVLVYDKSPEIGLLFYPAAVAAVFLTLAFVMFKKANEEMVDLL